MARISLGFSSVCHSAKGGLVMIETFTAALAGYVAIFVGAQVVGRLRKR